MSLLATDACLQQGRIGAFGQHLLVVVGFQYQVVGFGHIVLDCVGDVSDVGDEAEVCLSAPDAVSHVVRPVVWDFKGSNAEVAQDGGLFLLYDAPVDGAYFLGHAVAFGHAFVDGFGGEDGDVASFAQVAHCTDVVGMVVGDEYAEDAFEGYAAFAQHFFDGAYADAGIDEYAV